MKLYVSRLAPNPRRVRWLLAEKGVDGADAIEIVDVDLMAGAHKTPEFLADVGVANVPALILDDGVALTESLAICRYLEALWPAPNLFGGDAREAAMIEMWTRRAELLVAIPLMMAARHGHPAFAVLESQVPEIATANRARADASLALFEAQLGTTEWIAADRVTMADGVLYAGLEFARLVRFKIPETMPNLTRWLAAIRERPSAMAGG